MIYLNFHFMANIMFGFLPGPEVIVEKGYKRLLEILAQYPEIRSHLYASSRTGQIVKEEYPEVFQMILKAVNEGRLRIEFNGYEHAPFNCLSPESVNKQIEKGFEKDKEIWAQTPAGYWPSDCRWDPYVGYLLKSKGIEWVVLHWEDFKLSNPGGKYYPDWRKLDPCRPILVRCPMNVNIPAMIYSNVNYELFRPEQTEEFFNQLSRIQLEHKEDGYVSIGLDFETLLLLELKGIHVDGASVLKEFLQRLRQFNNIQHEFSNHILAFMPPVQEAFVRQGYWGHFGGAYPDGAQRILSLCDSAERNLLMCEDLLKLIKSTSDTEAITKEIEEIWEQVLEAENSEVRFTDPPSGPNAHVFYPREGVVIGTLEQAIHAFESARRIKMRLFDLYRKQ